VATIQIEIKDNRSIAHEVRYRHPLKQAIITTLTFFDLSDMPLKAIEIESYLFRTAASKMDVAIMLKRLQGEGLIREKNGFWFLKGRSKIVEIRQKRILNSKNKLKKVIFFGRFLKLVPFVRGIFLCNSLAFYNAKKTSDIDLFIVTRKKRLWISRTLIVMLATLLGIKRRPGRKKDPDRFCFSFFVSEKHLSLKKIYSNYFDRYFPSFWLAGFKPIYGFRVFNRMIRKNIWYKEDLPNHKFSLPLTRKDESKNLLGFIRFLAEKTIDLLGGKIIDRWLYNWQSKRVIEGVKNNQIGIGVIAGREILKTHVQDNRQENYIVIEERLKETLENI
jgi:predicted nucleotidyltransferase